MKFRRLFVTAVRKLLHDLFTLYVGRAQWANYKWTTKYLLNSVTRFSDVIPRAGLHSFGMSLPSFAKVRLNLLRTGVGRFCLSIREWDLAPLSDCDLRV